MIIYKITNKINSKIYIGQTTTSLAIRWKDHKRLKKRQMTPIKLAIQKYGEHNFIIDQIDSATSIRELNEKEEYWISFYNSTNKKVGYNLMSRSSGKGAHSPETIQKMSRVKKGKTGRKHSEETKRLFSLMRKGKPSPHVGKKRKPCTDQQKAETSKRFKGKPTHNKHKGTTGDMYAIKKLKNGYSVCITKVYLNKHSTLEKAKFVRDKFLELYKELELELGRVICLSSEPELGKLLKNKMGDIIKTERKFPEAKMNPPKTANYKGFTKGPVVRNDGTQYNNTREAAFALNVPTDYISMNIRFMNTGKGLKQVRGYTFQYLNKPLDKPKKDDIE